MRHSGSASPRGFDDRGGGFPPGDKGGEWQLYLGFVEIPLVQLSETEEKWEILGETSNYGDLATP